MGGALLLAVGLFGAIVAGDHGPTWADRWGMSLVPHLRGGTWVDISKISSPLVVGAVAVVCAAFALRRDWRLAAVCAAAPLVSVLLAQGSKGVFDRLDAGVPSYPSGSVTAVASVAAVVLLVTRAKWRWVVGVVVGVVVVVIGADVVALRWHYPTDAVAGAALGIAIVLVADGLVRPPNRRPARGRREVT